MTDAIAVINAGSSSLKFAVYARGRAAGEAPLLRGQVEGLGATARYRESSGAGPSSSRTLDDVPDHAGALGFLMARIGELGPELRLAGIGHRVVHGGTDFAEPVLVSSVTLAALTRLVPLAPQHQPHNLAPIEALRASHPDLPQVACFDTAFHRTQPELAQRFALPEALHQAGLRRYGFHGLSYESVAGSLPGLLGEVADGRVVVAHLGNGASLAALRARRCVATSMGLTPLDGLMMGTRAGSIDPGVLLHLMRESGYDEPRLSRLLQHESGLLGVSGISHDMRTLLASDEDRARLAVELFVYRLVRELGSHVAALGGLDALVFTGGVGEHAASIRADACAQLDWLGVELDPAANERHGPCISRSGARPSLWVVPTDEEGVIADHTERLLGG
jgi:acetate kinase